MKQENNDNYDISDYISDRVHQKIAVNILLSNGITITVSTPDESDVEDHGVKTRNIDEVDGYLCMYRVDLPTESEYELINKNKIISVDGYFVDSDSYTLITDEKYTKEELTKISDKSIENNKCLLLEVINPRTKNNNIEASISYYFSSEGLDLLTINDTVGVRYYSLNGEVTYYINREDIISVQEISKEEFKKYITPIL